jgi:hypothetical protein
VEYPVNKHRCNIDGALNHVDGNIDMIVCRDDGPRSNYGGIYPRSHRWGTQKTSKPNETDSQANIDIEVVNNIDWGNTALNCEGMEGAGSV